MRPKVGVSYNKKINGLAVISLARSVISAGADVEYIDYRKILWPHPGLQHEWREKSHKLFRTIRRAKIQAMAFFNDLDALVIPGANISVNPCLYEDYKTRITSDTDVARSLADMIMIHVCTMQGKPILGVCAGLQIYNVYIGGNIKQLNADDYLGQILYPDVYFDQNSMLSQILRTKHRRFIGYHHDVINNVGQTINCKGENLHAICAYANDNSKNVEAIESQGGVPILGVQFHPELDLLGVPNGDCSDKLREYIEAYKKEAKTRSNDSDLAIFTSFAQAAATHARKKVCNAELIGLSTTQHNYMPLLTREQSTQIRLIAVDTRREVSDEHITLRNIIGDVNYIMKRLINDKLIDRLPNTQLSYVAMENDLQTNRPICNLPPDSAIQSEMAMQHNVSIPMALFSAIPSR